MTALRARGITKRFGGVTAVDGVDLDLHPGEVVGLIGPNGAGKTTFFDCISGFATPDAGTVELGDRDVTGLPVEERARLGLGRTFQRLAVFETMTVRDHLLVAAEQAGRLRTSPWPWEPDGQAHDHVESTLRRFRLERYGGARAADLPTGILRRVEVARAVCTGAGVLLLDEPASGLDPAEVADLADVIGGLGDTGHAALLVEHDVGFVLDLADRVVVMHTGQLIAEGRPDEVVRDAQVREAYLGSDGEH